jgi:hypothetical protein
MSFFYNYFTGTGTAADAAATIAKLFVKKFNIVGSTVDLINSLTWKLRAIYSSFDGDFSWADLGGAILDLGEFLLDFTPAGKLADIVSFLWGTANVL